MGKKIAKLVYVSLMTRIIIDENATQEEMIAMARPKLIQTVNNDLAENIEEIIDDLECPHDNSIDFVS